MKDFWNFNIQLSVFKVWINQKLNQWKKCQLQMIKMECCSRLMFIFMSQLPHVQITNWKKHLKFKNQHLSLSFDRVLVGTSFVVSMKFYCQSTQNKIKF
jgi:hypothetical protein